jgi:methyl-branched lipid omega-hydroxylase
VPQLPTMRVDDIDLSDMGFWALPLAEREQAFALLRAERPLAHFEDPDLTGQSSIAPPPGRGYLAVTRHADVTEVSRHPEIYCSSKGAISIIDLPQDMVEFFASMISTDNPRHARLRRIVSAAFSPRRISATAQGIGAVADRLIDRVAPLGECDFVTELAAPLSLEIICNMVGLPPSEHATVFRCSNIIASSGDHEYIQAGDDPLEAMLSAGHELVDLLTRLSAFRVERPTDDLTTALISTNIDGEALTPAELASFFILLLTAGNETTRNSLSHGLVALTDYPDQRAIWQADIAGVTPTGVDEIVRWASPVNWMRRTVTEDTVLAGEELHVGDKVLLFYGSANRDETVFEDPYTFDVLRSPNPHVGFGAAGPHFCLGAHLARLEIEVMMRQLLVRLPDIVASGEPVQTVSRFVNGIKYLPCRFTPAAG